MQMDCFCLLLWDADFMSSLSRAVTQSDDLRLFGANKKNYFDFLEKT